MVDQPHGQPAAADRHLQRLLAQDALQPLGHRPADDLHRGQILDGGEVEPAFVSWDVGDVSEPDRIGRNGFEVAVEQTGRDRMGPPWRLSVVIGARRLPRDGRMPFSRMSLATERFEMRKPRADRFTVSSTTRRSVYSSAFNSAWIRGAP